MFFGWIGDRIPSRRTPFLLGLGFLGGATLSFALGKTVSILLIARLLQGLSSAVVFTFGRALLLDRVGKERIGRAMGFTGAALSAGLLLGPVVGGVLYEYGGYFTVFLPALGLIVAEMFLRLVIIEEKRIPSSGTSTRSSRTGCQDTGASDSGAINGAVAAQEQEVGLKTSNQEIEGEPQIETETEPLLPGLDPKINAYPMLLCSPRFMVAVVGLFVLSSIANGFDAILPAYALDAFDLSPSRLALLFLIMGVPMFLAPVSGSLTDRYGAKWPGTAGLVLLIPSLFALRLITPAVDWPVAKLMVLLCGIGIAFAVAMPPLQTEVSAVVADMETRKPGVFGPYGAYSQAYGLMNTAFAAGSMVGPLYAGFVRVWLGWGAITSLMSVLSAIVVCFVLGLAGGYGV